MPYCPACGDEYEEGVEKCPECGAELVAGPPPEDLSDLIEIHTAQFAEEAERLRDVLAAEGVDCLLRDMGMSMFPTSDQGGTRIMVPEDQAELAREIIAEALEEFEAEGPPEEEDPE